MRNYQKIKVIEKIVITTLLANVIYVILVKYHVISAIQMHAPNKFIRAWSMCEFCVFHAIAVPFCVPVIIYFGVEWTDVFIPLMAASLKNMLT